MKKLFCLMAALLVGMTALAQSHLIHISYHTLRDGGSLVTYTNSAGQSVTQSLTSSMTLQVKDGTSVHVNLVAGTLQGYDQIYYEASGLGADSYGEDADPVTAWITTDPITNELLQSGDTLYITVGLKE